MYQRRSPNMTPQEVYNYLLANGTRLDNGCLVWGSEGYGKTSVDGERVDIHRFVYCFYHKKQLPSDIFVLHKCDNKPCFEITHLFEGRSTVNQLDSIAKGRRNTPSGERHYKYRITDAQVAQMRELRSTRRLSYRAIGAMFGLSNQHAWELINSDARQAKKDKET